VAHPNSFAAALAQHDLPRLRRAFEAAKAATGETYDRTTLNRWLSGSIPREGEFIRDLGRELADPAIHASWEEARRAQTPSRARSVVSRFEGLTAEEKDWAFHEIRRDFVAEYPSIRSRLGYRIEIEDPDDPDDDHLRVRVGHSWTGDLPADATVRYVTEYPDLSSAYEDPACIFREDLPFTADRLQELLEAGEEQVLAVTPLDSRSTRGSRLVGQLVEPGVFAFANAAASEAHIQVNLSYPYPRDRPVFFLRFGRYQVPDTAEVTLVLRARSTSGPRAFPYMPPGRQRDWTWNLIRPNELTVSLGTGNTVLSEGDGLVLFWSSS
jgi:hypothetical protein